MAAKQRGTGFFDFAFIGEIEKKANLVIAQGACFDRIDAAEGAHPDNVAKARAMVRSAHSIRQLCLGMGNFALAHLDPKLKVLR